MAQVVGVRFERAGKIYYFEVGGLELSLGDGVIVESSRGLDYGTVATPVQDVAEKDVPQPLKPIMRIATIADEKRYEDYKAREPDAFEFCREQILAAGLPMKLIRAAYSFDGSKIVFYFTSDNRVDFRDLVKVLAAHFHARIELRQVGVRDEARLVGGYSSCGRELCCAAFLNGFHPVSIKMAKKQNLALNPAKISGVCGRLMCCLYYEYDENAPDEPETEAMEKPGCDNNCAACGNKPCAHFADDELDLELAVPVADFDELMMEQPKPRPRNRGGRGGKGERPEKFDKLEKGEKPGKNERPAKEKSEKSEKSEKPEKPEKPEKNRNNERKNDKNTDKNREKPEKPQPQDTGAEQGEKKPGGNKRRSRGRRGGRGRGGSRPEGQNAQASTAGAEGE